MAEFDIEKIYSSIASYKGLPFPLGLTKLLKYKAKQIKAKGDILGKPLKFVQQDNYPALKYELTPDEIRGVRSESDIYGRPIIAPLQLSGIKFGCGGSEAKSGKHFPFQPLMTLEGGKDIVKTKIPGAKVPGTVKEFINFTDYKIKIYGPLIGTDNYPWVQLNRLKELWLRNEAVEIKSDIVSGLFEYVVLTKVKLNDLKKLNKIQMYEIEAVSDGGLEVELLKG
jgi:hypothetical protein